MPSFFCMPLFACNRQVDSLDKRQCNLQAIPHDIERYARTLEELLLDMNHIKELPKSLFRLHKLRRLGLSDNDIHRLPSDIAGLMNLVELNLSRNDISDLPEDLRICRQLLILDISSNPIARLPDSITQVVSLTHLSLNDTSLTKLPQDIGKLEALKSLEVRENHLRSLPPSIAKLVNLVRFDLGQNELDDLPAEIGNLRSLQELYLDENSLEGLPEGLLRCTALEQLDVSSNRLLSIPEHIGELAQLTDLTLSHNCLSTLPNSIGRLKKLAIIKVDDNNITTLTPSFGSCSSLTEVYFMQNLLSELPNTVGNLSRLENLNLDKNQLTTLPPLIGNCTALSVLSLRDNQIQDLPMEIGKLANLRVLDLCNNRLAYLPYTVNVLSKLQALWLSENQSQAILKLQQETDARTGIKVLTCYLLPQQSAALHGNNRVPSKAFIGGPKVHFGDMESEVEEESPTTATQTGNFERHDTPHPKPNHLKHKKQVDGHVLHHEEQQPSTIALTKKVSEDRTNDVTSQGPRSALKHSTIHNIQDAIDSSKTNGTTVLTEPMQTQTRRVIIRREPSVGLGLSIAGGIESTPYVENDPGLFISKVVTGSPAERAGLLIGDKLLEVNGTSMLEQRHDVAVDCMQLNKDAVELLIRRDPSRKPQKDVTTPSLKAHSEHRLNKSTDSTKVDGGEMEVISTTINANHDGSLGFSVTGNETDGSVYIHSILPGGAVARDAKLRVGDQILSVNGTNVRGMRQSQVAGLLSGFGAMKETYLVVQRDKTQNNERKSPLVVPPSLPVEISVQTPSTSKQQPIASLAYGDTSLDGTEEDIELVRDSRNSLGLSVVGGIDHCSHPFGADRPGVFISKISVDSPAAHSRRLRVGDRILSVNGKNLEHARHNEAVEALKNSGQSLKLGVRHEPQPKGLKEVFIKRRPGQPIGLSICGGINSPPANPNDATDEGIFIEHVEKGSCAEECGQLGVGLRILEVNDDSLLGCTKLEAADLLRKTVNRARLLICDGFNTPSEMSDRPVTLNGRQNGITASSPLQTLPPPTNMAPVSMANQKDASPLNGVTPFRLPMPVPLPTVFDSQPLSTSSPVPPQVPLRSTAIPAVRADGAMPTTTQGITTFSAAPSKVPPPVAPKPKLQNGIEAREVESTSFSSKATKDSSFSSLNDSKTSAANISSPMFATGHSQLNSSFASDNTSSIHSVPVVVRTKKAENRLTAASPPLGTEDNESLEQKSADLQKRREWRQARLASLEAEAARAESLMNRVQQISRMGNISEERSISTSPVTSVALVRTLHQSSSDRSGENGTTSTKSTTQTVNGVIEKSTCAVEHAATRKEHDVNKSTLLNAGEFAFMDEEK